MAKARDERRGHPLSLLLEIARGERRLDDPADPPLPLPLHPEHVLAHRPVQRQGLGRRRERDHSRWAFVQVHADERGETATAFLAAATHFAELGIRIERVMTDNAKGYVESRAFQAVLSAIGATHKRTRTYRPQTDGIAEAFIWTLQREWAYARPYSSNSSRLRALVRFVETYNC